MKKQEKEFYIIGFFIGYLLVFLLIFAFTALSGCTTTTSWQYNKCYDLNHINDIECYEKDLSR